MNKNETFKRNLSMKEQADKDANKAVFIILATALLVAFAALT